MTRIRFDTREDFEPRDLVNYFECGDKMTHYYARSKTAKKHSCYKCQNKDCSIYRKSIKKSDIDYKIQETDATN